MQLSHRDEFPMLMDAIGCKTAIEVGCACGDFSRVLLRSRVEHLWMCDTFMMDNPGDVAQTFRGPAYAMAAEFGDRVTLLEMPSLGAVKLFAPGSIDFVYIDTMHDGPHPAAECEAWFPISSKIIAGHDYTPCNMEHRVAYSVMQAAEDLAEKHGLPLYVTGAKATLWPARLRVALASLSLADLGHFGANVPSWYLLKP